MVIDDAIASNAEEGMESPICAWKDWIGTEADGRDTVEAVPACVCWARTKLFEGGGSDGGLTGPSRG